MKNSIKTIIFLALLGSTVITSSCRKESSMLYSIRGKGETIKQDRSIDKAFTGIDLSIDAVVIYTPNVTNSIVIEAQKNIADNIELSFTADGNLKINYDRCVRNHKPIKIFVSSEFIKEAIISGSGNIEFTDTLRTETLKTTISGSGELFILANLSSLKTNTSGSGSVRIIGKGGISDHTISGSGNIEARDFACKNVTVNISGSGDANIFAEDKLDIRISGSGNVNYDGTPRIDSDISGSGNIHKF